MSCHRSAQGREKLMTDLPSNSVDDLNSDINIFSFIVRVWKETPSSEEGKVLLRGHITPIPDGDRRYFADMDEIPAFMQDYIKSMK
jgi:hypothetical protein